MIELTYFFILLISNVFGVIDLLSTSDYSTQSIMLSFLLSMLGYAAAYIIYLFLKADKRKKSKFFIKTNIRAFSIFMLLYLTIMIIYSKITGDGAAQGSNLYSSSLLASLFVPNSIFYFYFFVSRKKDKVMARINGIVFVIYNVLLGWTGVILTLFVLESYFVIKQHDKGRKAGPLKMISLSLLLALGIVFIGGLAYSIVYPLKYAIRYGTDFSFSNSLSLWEGMNNLLLRLNRIKTTTYVLNNMDDITYRYTSQNIFLLEFKSAFRPIIPSFIFKDKLFSNIGSCIYNSYSGGFEGINITDNCSIVVYFILLFKCDPASLLLSILLFLFVLKLFKWYTTILQTEAKQFDLLFFLFLFDTWSNVGSLENSIMNSYAKFIFFIPLLWILNVFKPRIRRRFLHESFAINSTSAR